MMIKVIYAVKTFCAQVLRELWLLRYWIFLTLVLCGVDQAIRYLIFESAPMYLLKLWVFYSLSVFSIIFAIGRIGRYVIPFVFILWTFIELLQFYVAWRFNMLLTGNWILIIGASSFVEVREFFKDVVSLRNLALLVLAWLLIGAVAFFSFRARKVFRPLSLSLVFISVLCFGVVCRMPSLLYGESQSRAQLWMRVSRGCAALNFIADTMSNVRDYIKLGRICNASPVCDVVAEPPPRVCVFVIGESLTRTHMSLYGYHRRTTPMLDQLWNEGEIIKFSDVMSPCKTTPECLRLIFTDKKAYDAAACSVTFASLLKKAGYHTVFLSCQGAWQNNDIVGAMLFRACDECLFLQGNRLAGTLPDGIVLPEIRRALDENKAPLAIFVHLYGCHVPAAQRIPSGFSRDWESDSVNDIEGRNRSQDDYDTAMSYVEFITSEIINLTKKKNNPGGAFVLLLSDHGESPDSGRWRDAKCRSTYEIPVAIWFSEEYRMLFPETVERTVSGKDRKLAIDQLFEGMLELTGVKGFKDRESEMNFLSPTFRPYETRKIVGNEIKYE